MRQHTKGEGHEIYSPWNTDGRVISPITVKPHDVYPSAPEGIEWCQCVICGEYIC